MYCITLRSYPYWIGPSSENKKFFPFMSMNSTSFLNNFNVEPFRIKWFMAYIWLRNIDPSLKIISPPPKNKKIRVYTYLSLQTKSWLYHHWTEISLPYTSLYSYKMLNLTIRGCSKYLFLLILLFLFNFHDNCQRSQVSK